MSSPGGGQAVWALEAGLGQLGRGAFLGVSRQTLELPGPFCEMRGAHIGFKRPWGRGKAGGPLGWRRSETGLVSPQQAFNAAAVVHHMRKLHMNLQSPGVRPEAENRPPVPAASRPTSPEITITETAAAPGPSVAAPTLTRLPCRHGPQPAAPGGRSLNCLVNGSLRISSSLVPMQQGPLAIGPCGCCSSCTNIGTKANASYCSEPTLLKKANKKQYVFPAPGLVLLNLGLKELRTMQLKKNRPGSLSHLEAAPWCRKALERVGGVNGDASSPVPTPHQLCGPRHVHLCLYFPVCKMV